MRLAISVAILVAAALGASACGSGSGTPSADSPQSSRAARNREVFQSLPVYPGSTPVREFTVVTAKGNDVLGRDYATADQPEKFLTFLYDRLAADGWQKENAQRFHKNGDLLALAVYGQALPSPGSGYTVSALAGAPVGTQVYFAMAVGANPAAASPSATATQSPSPAGASQ